MAKLKDILNITPEFLKEYEGKAIQYGDTYGYVSGGKITDYQNPVFTQGYSSNRGAQQFQDAGKTFYQYDQGRATSNPTLPISQEQLGRVVPFSTGDVMTLSDKGGLRPAGSSSYRTSEAFRYAKKDTDTYKTAEAGGFGMGPPPPTADQYTGEMGGVTSGGVQLYKLSNGSVTSTPPSGTARPAPLTQEEMTAAGSSVTAPDIDPTVQAAGQTGIVQNPNAPIGWGNDPITGKMVKITPSTTGTGWYDEVTGKDTPAGVGTPRPTATPIADQTLGLQAALDRNDPNNPTDVANIAYAKSKGLLATLTSPTGEKVQVAVGSQRANDLLSQNYTLGDKIGGDILTSETIAQESEIDTTSFQDNSTSSQSPADTTKAAEVTQKTIEDYIKLIEGKETETSQAVDTLQGDVLKLIGEQAGQTELLEDELKKAGADQFKENLKNINNEIGIKTAALNSRLAEIEATPMTLARMGGEEAKARRIAQSDIMFLQAQAQSAMNNLSFAQETAQAAVDAKYNPIIEELNIKLQQLKIIEGRENKEEATYAQALSLLLQEQKDAQVEAKNNEAGVNSIIMEIIANNPNISKDRIIDQIKNASSPIEAMQIAGGLATGTGYQYVATPAERDNYIAQGYELIQSGGRTYAKLGGGGSSQEVNACSDDRGRLLAVNFTSDEVANIQSDINEFGIEATVAGMSEDQAKAVRNIASGVTPTQESSVSAGERTVIGNINALMLDNASNDEIDEYITLKGYTKADFTDLLKDYTPTVSTKKWYEFWK